MAFRRSGFLLVEVLFSLVVITSFMLLCMKHLGALQRVQNRALKVLEAIDILDKISDEAVETHKPPFIPISQNKIESSLYSLSLPRIEGGPSHITIPNARTLRCMRISMTCSVQDEYQVCHMPVIFKDNGRG